MVPDIYEFPNDQMDIDFPIYGNDMPEGESFPAATQRKNDQHSELIESSSTVNAPMRRRPRAARVLPIDTYMELRNKDLAAWNTNYIQNMKNATRLKKQARAAQQAKKNAEHFVWGSGIGGIARQMPGTRKEHPFDIFIGDSLFELITGMSRKKTAGSKHDRDSGIDDATQEEARRVRQKTSAANDEINRGFENEGFAMPGDEDVELPREGAIALDDQQIFSAMPWNMSASIRGSSAIPPSGRFGIMGSIDQSKRGNRLVSASPLLGRGQPEGPEALRILESDGDFNFGDDELALPEPSLDPLESQNSPQTLMRVREALSAEGENFVAFVHEAIVQRRSRAQVELELMSDFLQADAAADIDEVTFEELLLPHENSKMIACQGLMMLLTLGSKGMLDVQQPEHLGEISIKLTEQAKSLQVIEISDGEESGDGDHSQGSVMLEEYDAADADVDEEFMQEELGSDEDNGHFEDQATSAAGREISDQDSLYED